MRSSHKYLLHILFVPGTVPGTEDDSGEQGRNSSLCVDRRGLHSEIRYLEGIT